jgi:hypothetical protein
MIRRVGLPFADRTGKAQTLEQKKFVSRHRFMDAENLTVYIRAAPFRRAVTALSVIDPVGAA